MSRWPGRGEVCSGLRILDRRLRRALKGVIQEDSHEADSR